MTPKSIQLPASSQHESLTKLLEVFHSVDHADWIEIDFSHMSFYHPGALVAILCQISEWRRRGKEVQLLGYRDAKNFEILQRMDFFKHLGLELEEDFNRRDPTGRFVEIHSHDHTFTGVDQLTRKIATCLVDDPAPGMDDFECFKYVLGEILTNARQHSHGQVFAYAQNYPKHNAVGIAIGDTGIGIRRSFEGTILQSELSTASLAIQKALEPEVSAALLRPALGYGQHVNRGIGLSMVSALVADCCGYLTIISENGVY
jgi:hypothetical protein